MRKKLILAVLFLFFGNKFLEKSTLPNDAKILVKSMSAKTMFYIADEVMQKDTATAKLKTIDANCDLNMVRIEKTKDNSLGWKIDSIGCPKI